MKYFGLTFSLLIIFFLSTVTYSQTTITIVPNATSGKDALLINRANDANLNYGNQADFASWAWTQGGGNTTARSLIDFDWSLVPTGATITNATVSFYCNTISAYTQLQSGSNASYLERVTANWNESTVTWNTQPATTTANRVTLASSTSNTQDYLNIDITQLVIDITANPTTSFGLMLKLQSESIYKAMVFGSSDHPDSLKRPVLKITYTSGIPCQNILSLRPNAVSGKDANIDSKSNQVNANFGSSQDLAAWSWTIGGDNTDVRGLIDFDLSSIPSNATINSARLSLYCNTISAITQLHSGLNESYLQRITTPWAENSVTWNNQPTTTTANQVQLNASSSPSQDYINIDVKNLIEDIKNNPTSSYGLMLKLVTESNYRSLIFASSDHPDSLKRPKLEICYTIPTQNTSLKVLTPNGGERLLKGSPYYVKWQNVGADTIHVAYSVNDSVWIPIASNVRSSADSVLWNTPNITLPYVKVKITHNRLNQFFDVSDSSFQIVSPPVLSLLYPNGGEVLYNTDTATINWLSADSRTINIHYTTDNNNWNLVAAGVSSTLNQYKWPLPDINSNTVRVKITDGDLGQFTDVSNANFSIFSPASIQLISPNGGELWYTDSTYAIKWTSVNVPLTDILYSINDSTWYTIATNISQTASVNNFNWKVPSILISNSLKVKVEGSADKSIFDKSDNTFVTAKYIAGGFANGLVKPMQLLIYPNPANHEVTIEHDFLKGNVGLQLLDMNGRVVMNQSGINQHQFTTVLPDTMDNGLYLLELRSNEGVVRKRLMIAR